MIPYIDSWKEARNEKWTLNWSEKKNRFNDVDNVKVVKWLKHSYQFAFILITSYNAISCVKYLKLYRVVLIDSCFSSLRISPHLRAREIKRNKNACELYYFYTFLEVNVIMFDSVKRLPMKHKKRAVGGCQNNDNEYVYYRCCKYCLEHL